MSRRRNRSRVPETSIWGRIHGACHPLEPDEQGAECLNDTGSIDFDVDPNRASQGVLDFFEFSADFIAESVKIRYNLDLDPANFYATCTSH